MTSPSPKPLTSAEHSSELGETARANAAQALSQLQTHPPAQFIPPTTSSAEATPLTPLSSVPPWTQFSLAYGSPSPPRAVFSTRRHTPGASSDHIATGLSQEFPSERHSSHNSAKRPRATSEHRAQKLRWDGQGSHQPSDVPDSPAERNLVHRGHGSNRAPAAGPYTRILARELPDPSARRHAGRPRKDPLPSDRDQLSRRRDELQLWKSISPTSHDPSGATSSGPRPSAQDKFAFGGPQAAAIPASSYEPPSAGFHHQLADLPPRFPQPDPTFSSRRLLRPDIADYALFTKKDPTSDASSPTYPHRTMPLPSPVGPTQSWPFERFPPQIPLQTSNQDSTSAELDGFKILRNAVPIAAVSELNSVVSQRLPINAHSETHQAYVTPFQAYQIRDSFNGNCRDSLLEFYTPMQKKIPAMPKTSVVGSFLPGDQREARYSLLHVGFKDQIYVHIALNRLSWQSGFYNILKGSHLSKHPSRTPVESWSPADVILEEGDAIIWRGDLTYFLSPGGGGQWMCLTYEWGPGLIDLTEE